MLTATLLCLFAAPQAELEQAPAPEAPFAWASDVLDEDLRAAMPRIKQLMRDGLRREQPSSNFVARLTGSSLFNGSYDWHSNLFAHWALLVTARVEGDEELRDFVLAPLTPKALESERQRLQEIAKRSSPLPSFPYDQGWLVVFLSELQKHRPDDASLRDFRIEVEERLLHWLETSDFPARARRLPEGSYPGFYRSLLISYFQLRLSQPISEGAQARLDRWQAEKLAPSLPAILTQHEAHPYDFVYVPTMPALLHELAPFPERPKLVVMPAADLPHEVDLGGVHVLGMEISTYWPLAARAHDGDLAARRLLNHELRTYLKREDLWSENFLVVSHWVPQFLWLTYWLAEGRP